MRPTLLVAGSVKLLVLLVDGSAGLSEETVGSRAYVLDVSICYFCCFCDVACPQRVNRLAVLVRVTVTSMPFTSCCFCDVGWLEQA
jgi:hypothetical protein